jgi:uncharacterized membrane protein
MVVNIIMSVTMILGGYSMRYYAKKPVNRVIGFRTSRSMKNRDTWYFANKKCGDIWLVMGVVSLVVTLASIFALMPDISDKAGEYVQAVIAILQFAAIMLSGLYVQLQLKKKFS